MDTRSKTSPYASSIVKVEFGSTKVSHFIPRALLQIPDWISHASKSGMYTVCVPKVREEIGHILIHYMYTGRYQALLKDDFNFLINCQYKSDFIMALGTLFATEIYHLPKLHKLAKVELRTQGKFIEIISKLQLIDLEIVTSRNLGNRVSSTSESRRWLNEYLKAELQAAYLQNEKIFDGLSIFDNINDTTLVKSLSKLIFEIYSHQIQKLKKAECEVILAKSEIDWGNPSDVDLGDRSHGRMFSDPSLNRTSLFGCVQNEIGIAEKSIESFSHRRSHLCFPQREPKNQVKFREPFTHIKSNFCSAQNEAENQIKSTEPFSDESRTFGPTQNNVENQVRSTTPNSRRKGSHDSIHDTVDFEDNSPDFRLRRMPFFDPIRNRKEKKDKLFGPELSLTSYFGFDFHPENAENEIKTLDSDSSHSSTFIFTPISPPDDSSLDEIFEKKN